LVYARRPIKRVKQLTSLLGKLKQAQIPTTITMNHKHLTKEINQLSDEVRTLVNMDYHSDITNKKNNIPFNEGTWVNFIKWKGEGTYIWIRPLAKLAKPQSRGRVDRTNLRFGKALAKKAGWKSIRSRLLYLPKNFTFVGAGISISPRWVNKPILIYTLLQCILGHPISLRDIGKDSEPISCLDAVGGDITQPLNSTLKAEELDGLRI